MTPFTDDELLCIAGAWGIEPDEAAALIADAIDAADRDAATLALLAENPADVADLQGELIRESEVREVGRIVGLSDDQAERLRELLAQFDKSDGNA